MRTTQFARDYARRTATATLTDLDRKASGSRVRCDAKTTTREAVERRTAQFMLDVCDDAEMAAQEWPIPAGATIDQLYRFARAAMGSAMGWAEQEDGDALAEEQLREAAFYLRKIAEMKASVAA